MSRDEPANDLPAKLGAPAQRALAGAGIRSLEEVSRFSEAEIRRLHGIGPNALAQLRTALAEKGLAFSGKKTLDPQNETR